MFTVQELDAYSSSVRRKFADRLAQLPLETLSKNREASFYNMKNIILHMIDNEDWMVNWMIPGRSEAYVRRKWEEYTDMQAVIQHLEEVEGKTRTYMKNLSQEELDRRVEFVIRSGEKFNLTVEDCLFQSFTEQLYHMGELIALLWQENVEPPRMEWFSNNPRTKPSQ